MNNATLLDASALLALIQNEEGASLVSETIAHGRALISTVNLSEVIAKLAENGMEEPEIVAFQDQLPVEIIDFNHRIALAAGLMRPGTRRLGLSLGDRACLATAQILGNLPILTGDKLWAELTGEFKIILLRDKA